jgi:cell fate regulator YaaT (PSP1 superfamily)
VERVVGIRLRKSGPIIYASADDGELRPNSYVVVQTDKGQEMGWVVSAPKAMVFSQPEETALLTIVRKATVSDFGQWQSVKDQEHDAFKLARSKVRELGLAMKIIDAHYTLDGLRLTITFGAEGRVDFRPLLRTLGPLVCCRVELHQVGDRDVAKMAGGIGRCGRTLCCATWMTKFANVSIRMAKEQELPISAEGLAGGCGRLRCCLRFEYEQYREVNRYLPRIGEEVDTSQGRATVIVGHRIKETVSVRYSDDRVLELPMMEVRRLRSTAD